MHILNHRSVQEILEMIVMVGRIVGAHKKADALVNRLLDRLAQAAHAADQGPRPKIYFEEWDSPMISAIRWVSELIEIAGGRDCFQELSACSLGKDRIIPDPKSVIERAPDVIVGSWCGKKFRPEQVAQRPGWQSIPAVANAMLFEIKSPLILQPGPAALTDGLDGLCAIVQTWRRGQPATA